MPCHLLTGTHILIIFVLLYNGMAQIHSSLQTASLENSIFIPKYPVYEHLRTLQSITDACNSVTSDDGFISGYFFDPCTGRISNMNFWRLSSSTSLATSSACPTVAPSRTASPKVTMPPVKSEIKSKTPSALLPTYSFSLSPSRTRTPTKIPTMKRPSNILPSTQSSASPSSQRRSPSVPDDRHKTIAPIPTVSLSTITLPPTMPFNNRNDTQINPIGTSNPNSAKHFTNNNALALGLGLAAFVLLAFLISRRIMKKKQGSKFDNEDEVDSIECADPKSSQHVGECHRSFDGTKWFDPSCPLCQETLLRRKVEEDLAAQRRMNEVDVHYCSSAICEKCHRSQENEVSFIKVAG